MKKQVPLTPVLAIALLIVTAVGYFTLIGPKREESAALAAEIADLETNLMTATRPKPATPQVEIDVADLFRLAKAMPDADDMPGIILEVNSIASSAGIEFLAIQPQSAVAAGSHRALPITLTFEGNYYDLTDFLYRLRTLVTVKDGKLHASGRLYPLDALDMHEAKNGFPDIEALLTVSAYAFGGDTPAGAPGAPTQAAPTAPTETGTSSTTTTTDAATAETQPASPEQGANQVAGGKP